MALSCSLELGDLLVQLFLGRRQLRNLPLQLRHQPHQLVALRGREVGLTHSQSIKTCSVPHNPPTDADPANQLLAGLGWIAFGEVSKSEAAHADASFSMVNHQTGRMGESLDVARTFITTEISANIGQITDISTLLDEWSPRYQQAQTGYRRFDGAIIAVENSADAYFAAQRALTGRFHSQDVRTRARADDDAEFQQYEQWRERASRLMKKANLRRCDLGYARTPNDNR